MSFNIHFSYFKSGDISTIDGNKLKQMISPFIVKEEPENGYALLRFADGETDFYGTDHLEKGFGVSHIGGAEVWKLLFDIAKEFDMTIMAPDCPIMVTADNSLLHLPKDMPPEKKVVGSAEELLATITAGL